MLMSNFEAPLKQTPTKPPDAEAGIPPVESGSEFPETEVKESVGFACSWMGASAKRRSLTERNMWKKWIRTRRISWTNALRSPLSWRSVWRLRTHLEGLEGYWAASDRWTGERKRSTVWVQCIQFLKFEINLTFHWKKRKENEKVLERGRWEKVRGEREKMGSSL